MRRKEILSALAGIHVAHHNEESRVLQVEVCVSVHYRISARLYAYVRIFLYGLLSESRAVFRRIIFREVSDIGSKIAFQHFGNLETDE